METLKKCAELLPKTPKKALNPRKSSTKKKGDGDAKYSPRKRRFESLHYEK